MHFELKGNLMQLDGKVSVARVPCAFSYAVEESELAARQIPEVFSTPAASQLRRPQKVQVPYHSLSVLPVAWK